MGFQYVPALIVPQLCVEKRRALAIAIAVGGCPLGSFIFSPALQFLINTYGWRGAILVTGAFILNGCPFGLLLIPPKVIPQKKVDPECQKKKDLDSTYLYSTEKLNDVTLFGADMKTHRAFLAKLRNTFDFSVLKSGTILGAVFILWTLWCLGFPVFANFLPLVASSYGISNYTSSFILSIFGLSDFAGRLLFGIIGSFNKINPVFVWCFITISGGLAQLCLTWLKSLPALYFLAFSFGLSVGKNSECFHIRLTEISALKVHIVKLKIFRMSKLLSHD